MVKKLTAPPVDKGAPKTAKQDDGDVPDFTMPTDTGKKMLCFKGVAILAQAYRAVVSMKGVLERAAVRF